MIERGHPRLSIRHQCALLGLHRSSLYYVPAQASEENLCLMHLIDEQYTRTPFYGSRRMTAWLRGVGDAVNRKRVLRLMGQMGLEAIYPRPHLSVPGPEHRVYPYLLHGVEITRPNQVWGTDITYIPMKQGFMYLVAIMDWYSRFVLSWELSNTLDVGFCLVALEGALEVGKPEIFNSDQGVQFTSRAFTGKLEEAGVAISMDGRGRAFDNIFVERLWRTVKYEGIYIKEYGTVLELEGGLDHYFWFYNHERPHQALAYQTPAQMYLRALTAVQRLEGGESLSPFASCDRMVVLTMGSIIR
jgi:putative transposase